MLFIYYTILILDNRVTEIVVNGQWSRKLKVKGIVGF